MSWAGVSAILPSTAFDQFFVQNIVVFMMFLQGTETCQPLALTCFTRAAATAAVAAMETIATQRPLQDKGSYYVKDKHAHKKINVKNKIKHHQQRSGLCLCHSSNVCKYTVPPCQLPLRKTIIAVVFFTLHSLKNTLQLLLTHPLITILM